MTLGVCVGHEQIVYQNYDSIGNIIPHRLTILHLSYYIFNEKKKKKRKKYNIYIDVKHKVENYNTLPHKYNLFEFTKSEFHISIFEYYV